MKPEEKKIRSKLLSKKEIYEDKPEIAVEYARWLLQEKRYKDAELITRTALEEGPRFDLYEMRAYSTLLNLEQIWKQIQKEQSIQAIKTSTDIYNEGLHSSSPDWRKILKLIH